MTARGWRFPSTLNAPSLHAHTLWLPSHCHSLSARHTLTPFCFATLKTGSPVTASQLCVAVRCVLSTATNQRLAATQVCVACMCVCDASIHIYGCTRSVVPAICIPKPRSQTSVHQPLKLLVFVFSTTPCVATLPFPASLLPQHLHTTTTPPNQQC